MSVDSTIALCTLPEARLALGIPSATINTVADAAIEDMINRSSDFANTYTGRILLERSYTEYYNGDGTDLLILRQYPIISVNSVYDDPVRAWTADTEVISADRIVDKVGGMIRLCNNRVTFMTGKGNVRAIYSAGYAAASIPHALKDAVLMIVQHHYKRIYQDQRIGLASETVGDRTLTYSQDAIPPKAREILNRYRSRYAPGYSHA